MNNTIKPDALLEQAWTRWQDARQAYNGLPDPGRSDVDGDAIEAEEARLWTVMDETEEAIRAAVATTKRGAAIQLWVALAHSIDTQGQDEAISRGDLTPILATEGDLDWNARLVVSALRSLAAAEA
jgi:hypothetical protein